MYDVDEIVESHYEKVWEDMTKPDAWEKDGPERMDVYCMIQQIDKSAQVMRDYIEAMQDDDVELFLEIYDCGALRGYSLKITLINHKDIDGIWNEIDRLLTEVWNDDETLKNIYNSFGLERCYKIGEWACEHEERYHLRKLYDEMK